MFKEQTDEARSNYVKQRSRCKATLKEKKTQYTNSKLIHVEKFRNTTLTKAEKNKLAVWERKMLKRIYGGRKEGQNWIRRTNEEHEEL